jgi:lactobin A/cerein 7B family class IIb bacteriocin
MATIKIANLNPVGSEFFNDSESYLDLLNDSELDSINGGLTPVVIYTVAVNTWWFVGGGAAGLATGIYVSLRK